MKVLTGKIVSLKMAKTAIVEVESQRMHRLYHKLLKKTKRIKAHYENIDLSLGNTVKIVSIRPISKEKFYKIAEKV